MSSEGNDYLVGYGSAGAVGRFAAPAELACRRGDRVVVESPRGLEMGTVLCPATARHARLLPPGIGLLRRRAGTHDEEQATALRRRSHQLFEEGRRTAADLALPVDLLDVELLLDGRSAVVQYVAAAGSDCGPLVEVLARHHGVDVLLEDVAPPAEAPEEHGCGKPDCGREAGGCSSCASGGCSSCGSKGVDLRDYFAHLRGRMEEKQGKRVPLL